MVINICELFSVLYKFDKMFLAHFFGLYLMVFICTELQPHICGWLLASIDGQKTGIIPANYVRVLGKRRGTKHSERSAAKLNDVLPVTADRTQHCVQQQKASTISRDDTWSFDDVNG